MIEALAASGAVQQRIVVADASSSLDVLSASRIPLLALPSSGTIRNVPQTAFRALPARSRLRTWYQKTKPIVHVAMASPWDQFYLDIPKRSGAPILLTIHDAKRHIGEESRFIDMMEGRLIRMADHIAVLSSYAADTLRARIGNIRPVHVVSPGLVMDSRPPQAAKAAPAGGPVKFLFFGRIQGYKGLDILLEAWRLVKARHAPPMQLTVAGGGDIGPYRSAFEQVDDVELIHQWISDEHMQELFTSHHVNVLPYREGSTSATSLAGMWVGMPSIATPVAAFAEQLRDGYNALISKDMSPAALSECILELARSAELYERLAHGTHEQAIRLSAPAVAENWRQLYEEIWLARH
ncbi:MAG: glycosyltransferase family 4 protein [Hyphomicrobium sp.]